MNFADVIKKCSMEAVEASVPCDAVLGSVVQTDPLRINAGEMELPEDVVLIAEHLLYKEEEISLGIYDRTVVISEGLKEGDNVVLLRKRGGESYIVIGKI